MGGGSSGSGSLCSCSSGSGEDGGPGGFPVCGSERRRRSLRRGGCGGCLGPGRNSRASRANGPGAGSRAVPLPDARSGLSGEWGGRRGARAGGGAERGPGSDSGGGRSRRDSPERDSGPEWGLGRQLASPPAPRGIVSVGSQGIELWWTKWGQGWADEGWSAKGLGQLQCPEEHTEGSWQIEVSFQGDSSK